MLSREELLKLDISKIRSNGRFVDINIPKMFYLEDREIAFLRKYYNDPTIARDVDLEYKEEPKKYKVTREDKYTGYKAKTKVRRHKMIPVILFGTLVFISVTFIAPKLISRSANNYESSGIIYEDPTVQDIRDELERYEETTYMNIDEMSERVGDLMYFCNIYQVDFNKVYEQLKVLTNNFTSDDYVNKYHIPGVTCKGEEVYASSERELLLLYTRCCKQIPSKVGLNPEGLYVTNDFDNKMNYYQTIYDCSKLVGVDPCLVYGIIMSESGFDSEIFRNNNNPAGLRNADSPNGFWMFDTPEEGIVETCLEVRKYNRNGLTEIADIGKVYCPVGSADDNGLNANWVGNVTHNTEYAREHFDEVFDIEEYVKR